MAQWRTTKRRHGPGTPLRTRSPRSSNSRPAPATRSRTAGDENLSCAGLRHDSRGDVEGDPADPAVDDLALARVDPGTDLEPQGADIVGYGARAADRAARPVEGGDEAVPGRVQLLSAIAGELLPDQRVVPGEQRPPLSVPERGCPLGRSDDVREEDRGEDALRLGRLSQTAHEQLRLAHDEIVRLRVHPGVAVDQAGNLFPDGSGNAAREVFG